MIHALERLTHELGPETHIEVPTGGLENPAVARCEAERNRVYQALLKKKKRKDDAEHEANFAYRQAMPAPVGYSNICDFIACVTYGMLMRRLWSEDGPRLLYAAQVALSTIAPQSKTKGRDPSPSVP